MVSGASGGLLAPANRAVTAALVAVMVLASYNNLAVTSALPSIGHDLGRVVLLPWVVTAELLAGAIAVLAVGPFIDGSGSRRAFRVSVVCTATASGLCAVAPSMETLVAARSLQGFSNGAMIGTAITCIGLVFDDATRPRAYALTASVWAIMGAGAPATAALLVSTLGWRAVFAVSLVVAVMATAVGWDRMPATPHQADAEPIDRRGLLLISGATVVLLLAVADIELWNLALLASGCLLAVAYWYHARGHPWPIVRPAHVIGSEWWPVHAAPTLAVAGGTGANVFLPLYLQGARGTSATTAAFSVLWLRLSWSLAAWGSGKLQERMRAPAVVILGAVVLASSGAAAAVLAYWRAPIGWLFAVFACLGCGVGVVATTCLSLLQRWAADREMGRMTSAHQFLRMLGFSLGAAVSGLVVFKVVDARTGDVESVRGLLGDAEAALNPSAAEALESAYTWSLVAMAVISASALPMALILARRCGPDTISRL